MGFGTGNSGTKATVGAGYEFMMSGTFDNAYYTSSTPTGHLYVVGNTGPANNTLYQIPINNNVMSPSIAGPEVSSSYTNGYYAAGLQVSEFYAGGTNDYIFLSVLAYGFPSGWHSALAQQWLRHWLQRERRLDTTNRGDR